MHVTSLHLSFRIIHASPQLVHAGFYELTGLLTGSYARSMMARLMVMIAVLLIADVCLDLRGAEAESEQKTEVAVAEDYVLYDQVVTSKFLTSNTQLVVIERMTRFRLSPDQEGPTTIEAFQEQEYFNDKLPKELVQAFISVNRQPSRLEGRFQFGVGYRFATGDMLEEPEVSLARPITVAHTRPIQAAQALDHLAFSRIARSPRHDHALMYVETLRSNGTGAGFLMWCRRQGKSWTLFDTEVIWTSQPHAGPEGLGHE
jgi:hypothetical protein